MTQANCIEFALKSMNLHTKKSGLRDHILKPPLKWAGGKRWLVPHLRPLWQSFSERRLVEPFCGGLAVALGLNPRRALLNDRNSHLISFYSWLKRGLNISIRMENDEQAFYKHRERFNEIICDGKLQTAEAASLFYYLNRTGFNGLCRFNRSGKFNVPFGDYKQINYVRDFSKYKSAFGKWDFTNGDFEAINLDPSDFVYADPPYDVQFTQYSKEAFGWEEQVRAAEWLAKHKGHVVLSNQATDKIVALYESLGFELSFLAAPRRINCTGDRTPATEVLAIKRATKKANHIVFFEGPEMTIKEWLHKNKYEDVLKKISVVETGWANRGTKTRRNWGDVLAGHIDGKPKTIEGVKFPVLSAARRRKGWTITKNCLSRNNEAEMPGTVVQMRWKKCKTHSHDPKKNRYG